MSGGGGENSGQDVELNLAPIIDCFTVLITYLLVTASFISLAALDVGVSASGTAAPAAPSADLPPMALSLEIHASGSSIFKVRGGALQGEMAFNVRAPMRSGGAEELAARLGEILARWPAIKEVNVTAEPSVLHGEIVKTINEVQKTSLKVYIAS